MKKCVIYICDNCGFEEDLPIENLREDHQFDEDDLSTYPKFECHGCHRHLIIAKKFENLPTEYFPKVNPDTFFDNF